MEDVPEDEINVYWEENLNDMDKQIVGGFDEAVTEMDFFLRVFQIPSLNGLASMNAAGLTMLLCVMGVCLMILARMKSGI